MYIGSHGVRPAILQLLDTRAEKVYISLNLGKSSISRLFLDYHRSKSTEILYGWDTYVVLALLTFLYLMMFHEYWPFLTRFLWNNEQTAFWTMIQALAVAITLFLIYGQLKAQVRQSESQRDQVSAQRIGNMFVYLTALDQKWDTFEYRNARQSMCNEYLKGDITITSHETLLILAFFEELGIYNRFHAFEPEILWSVFSERIIYYWELSSAKIDSYRTITKDRTFYEDFETMVKAINKHSGNRYADFREKSKEEIRQFAELEITKIGKFNDGRNASKLNKYANRSPRPWPKKYRRLTH